MCSNSHEMEQDPNVTATFTEYQKLNPVLKRCAHDCTGGISSLSNGIDGAFLLSPDPISHIRHHNLMQKAPEAGPSPFKRSPESLATTI